jgi:hypothetical protein
MDTALPERCREADTAKEVRRWTWRELNPNTCVYKTPAPNLAGPNNLVMSDEALREIG